jgi:hypothetical protein
MLTPTYYVGLKNPIRYIRQRFGFKEGEGFAAFITTKIQDALRFQVSEDAERLAGTLQQHPELSESLVVIRVDPTPEMIWDEIETLTEEMREQSYKIRELESVVANDSGAHIVIGNVKCELDDSIARGIVTAMLQVAKDQFNTQICLKSKLLDQYQNATKSA